MPPGERTTSDAVPDKPNGNWAVIVEDETLNSGRAMLLTVAHTLPSSVGNGIVVAETGPCAKPEPLI